MSLFDDLNSFFEPAKRSRSEGPRRDGRGGPGAPSAPLSAVNIDYAVGGSKNHFQTPSPSAPQIDAKAPQTLSTASTTPGQGRPTSPAPEAADGPKIGQKQTLENEGENKRKRGSKPKPAWKQNRERIVTASPKPLHEMEELPEKSGYRVFTFAAPRVKASDDPALREQNFKEPTPDSEWQPQWRPRKRPPGTDRSAAMCDAARRAAEDDLGIHVEALVEELPRNLDGTITRGKDFLDALCRYMRAGGTMRDFAHAAGISLPALYAWVNSHPEAKSAVAQARVDGADAIAEAALAAATTPVQTETTVESYDGQGVLLRRDVKRGDDVFARKLAYQGRMDLLKKWAPEKYGDKIEVKTTSTMAERILLARRRIMMPEDVEDAEAIDEPAS